MSFHPKKSGTGSVIVSRAGPTEPWVIEWWDAHFLGDNSTNNFAEHTALLRGLQECGTRYANSHQHVTIVGDSQLVINQVTGAAASRHHALQILIQRSRAQLRHLHSYSMQHTLRDGNKMADRLANWAMDQRRTSALTSPDPDLFQDLAHFLPNDTTAPWTATTRRNRLLPHVTKTHNDTKRATPHRKRRRNHAT